MKTAENRQYRWVLFLGLGMALGCAKHEAKTAHDHETMVPERTQREAERNMAGQQIMMQDLNSTPSERAGAAHDLERDRRHDRQNDEERE